MGTWREGKHRFHCLFSVSVVFSAVYISVLSLRSTPNWSSLFYCNHLNNSTQSAHFFHFLPCSQPFHVWRMKPETRPVAKR